MTSSSAIPVPESVRGESTQLPVLDSLRGLALVLVLLFHFGTINYPAGGMEHWLRGLFMSGWCGVDLFFVLSGFLITGILFAAK